MSVQSVGIYVGCGEQDGRIVFLNKRYVGMWTGWDWQDEVTEVDFTSVWWKRTEIVCGIVLLRMSVNAASVVNYHICHELRILQIWFPFLFRSFFLSFIIQRLSLPPPRSFSLWPFSFSFSSPFQTLLFLSCSFLPLPCFLNCNLGNVSCAASGTVSTGGCLRFMPKRLKASLL